MHCQQRKTKTSASGKQHYVTMLDFQQYITEFTVENFRRYPMRCSQVR